MAATLFDGVAADAETAEERLARLDREAEEDDRRDVMRGIDELDPDAADYPGVTAYPDIALSNCWRCGRVMTPKGTTKTAQKGLPDPVWGYRQNPKRPAGHKSPTCKGCWLDLEGLN